MNLIRFGQRYIINPEFIKKGRSSTPLNRNNYC
jgi:hypothetical protein